MYLELINLEKKLQAFILKNQVFIPYNMLDLSSPRGVRNGFAIF